VSNTDGQQQGGPPETIPYSRFTEVNGRLQELKPYEVLQQMGIDPDSAVRLVSFEQAYMEDPRGTLSSLIDQQSDLPETQKTALKALLSTSESASDGAGPKDGEEGDTVKLPAEASEALDYVRELKREREDANSQQRLQYIENHWRQQDEQDGIKASDRQRLLYIQSAAGSDQQFKTLEDLSDAARAMFLEDQDVNLGAAVQHRGTGTPRTVPSSGLPGTPPLVPKSMKEARQLIEADIKAGRFPDLQPGG
jgi:hypothetical protein